MKKLALTFAMLWTACALTLAGTEPYKTQQQTEIAPSCAQFGGFDVGINVGGAFHSWTWDDRDSWVDNFSSDWALGGVSKDRGGVTAGGSLGYNWQKGCALLGLVVDGSWTSIDGSTRYAPTDDPNSTILHLKEDVNFFGTARARTGVVVDSLLLYVTGGFVVADIDHRWTVMDIGEVPPVESFSSDSTRWGGVGGVGTEWAINDRWSFRSEFLYCYLGEENTSGFSPNGSQTVHFDNQDSMIVARAGIVFRFGGGR